MSSKILNNKSIIRDGKTFEEVRQERSETLKKEHFKAYVDEKSIPKSFEEIFSDLSEFSYHGHLDLSRLNLNSLKGCPHTIYDGYFNIENNPNLKSLDYFPTRLANDQNLFFNYALINKFKNIPGEAYKNVSHIYISPSSDFYNGTLDTEALEKSIVLNFHNLKKFGRDFRVVDILTLELPIDHSRVEKLYELAKKLEFKEEKLNRALSLLENF